MITFLGPCLRLRLCNLLWAYNPTNRCISFYCTISPASSGLDFCVVTIKHSAMRLTKKERLEEIRNADDRNHIAYVRFLCERFLRDYRDHAPTYLRLARHLISLFQYEKAEDALERGERIAPKEWLHAFAGQRGHLLLAQGKFAEAEKMFLTAHDLELDEDSADYLIFAGSASHSHGDLKRAEFLYRMASECEGGPIDEALFNLGGVLLAEGRFQEAANCYERALKIDPECELARDRLEDVRLILNSEK
jgi:tetratricopeptide (TPR) repeat protein